MNIEKKEINLYGSVISLSAQRVATNTIWVAFSRIAESWHKSITENFFNRFDNLEDLYRNGENLANEVRSSVIEQGMKCLSNVGIYHISEQQFYEQFFAPLDAWDENFESVAIQFEEIFNRTDELDSYRTARRQNRRQWVGYGAKSAVYEADGKNLVSNVGHGVFNLMAKGVTAIGNAIKKDEIFKAPSTKNAVVNGVANLIEAGFHATLAAINSEQAGTLHEPTADEISKARAIVENVNKGRIPKESVLPSLIKALEIYPYERDVYIALLSIFGGDNSRLDEAADYFGVASLQDVKQDLFEAKLSTVSLVTVKDCKSNLPWLQEFANNLCYKEFEGESKNFLDKAINAEFNEKIRTLELSSLAACNENLQYLSEFAKEIGYLNFDADWIKIVNLAIENDFKREASKYQLHTEEECEANLPILEVFAKEIGYAHFPQWAENIRGSATENPTASGVSVTPPGSPKKRRNWSAYAIIVVISIISLALVNEYIDNENSKKATLRARRAAAIEDQLRQEKEEAEKIKLIQQTSTPAPSISERAASEQLPSSGSAQGVTKLSDAAQKAIQEGFVEIREPAVEACVESKISALRKERGQDEIITFAVYNEFAVECGFNM